MEIDINNKNIRDERACYENRHEVIFIQLSSWNDILHLNMKCMKPKFTHPYM